ncbi:hypothetical protein PHPALM_20128 [Phytophthora palmivora]|uniref:Uncharacterized protein n=1 Tax=Phytophthora palmivora TaxID=4796 RepID=A0A2P4XFL7_9STRA|nr:hypothetical protein PHPALM_20128 [Phytophthora palmivora]
MGKGSRWSDAETVQLSLSWLEISEDPIRAAGKKTATFFERVYQHWKLNPEVTKFEGIYMKLKCRERSG